MREDALSQLSSEFKLWGVKFTSNVMNSGHIELVWRATPDKETRRYIIPKTSSDWRGPLNARSKIRQLFKADGLTLKQECAKPKPVLHKALEIPQHVEKDADQIRMLRAEVADLTDWVVDMAGIVSTLRDVLVAQRTPVVEEPVQPQEKPPSPIPESKKPSVRSITTIDFVSDAWSSTAAIARDMGLPANIAYRKLYYLMRQDIIELSGGSWRKKPMLQLVEKRTRAT